VFKFFLSLHIIAGTIGLVIGPISGFAKKRKGLHTRVGFAYLIAMSILCLSACALAILNWKQSWWFLFVAAFSFSFALKGYLAAKRRGPSWMRSHISGMLGSYIAMTTALLVVNASKIPGYGTLPTVLWWILPTIIGTPLIVSVTKRYTR
jgi:hypothetical protein